MARSCLTVESSNAYHTVDVEADVVQVEVDGAQLVVCTRVGGDAAVDDAYSYVAWV